MDRHTADQTPPASANQIADQTATVSQLLGSAGLTPSGDEIVRFVAIYPLMRAQADGLYAAELAAEEPALRYDPTIGFG